MWTYLHIKAIDRVNSIFAHHILYLNECVSGNPIILFLTKAELQNFLDLHSSSWWMQGPTIFAVIGYGARWITLRTSRYL